MAVIKRSVSFRPEVWAEVARLAEQEGTEVSALVNAALVHYVRLQRGLELVRQWEREHGAFTAAELAEADRMLDEAGVSTAPGMTSIGRADLR